MEPAPMTSEQEKRVYDAFRNELGKDGAHLSDHELRLEVDAFLKATGQTLADIDIICIDDAGRGKH